MLGCGTYRAFIQERGGGTVLAEVPWQAVNFGRRLDDVSVASCTVGAAGTANEACCSVLGVLDSWEHELAVWRDGDPDNDDADWVGVVWEPDYDDEGVVIPARDLAQWFERRWLPFDRSYTDTDLGVVFAQYVDDALAADPSPNISVSPANTGVTGDRTVVGAQHRRAMDEMRELMRSGVDMSMIGRTMMVGGGEVPTDPIALLTTEAFTNARLKVRGGEAASQVAVIGSESTTPGVPIVGEAGGFNPRTGLVQVVYSESSIRDDPSAAAAAVTRWQMLQTPPVYITARLVPEAPVDFTDLVPGARVELAVRVGCRDAIGTWRLLSVDAGAAVNDEGAVEEGVAVTLIPLGTIE